MATDTENKKRREYYKANRERLLGAERARKRAPRNIERALLARAKSRAKRDGLLFSIDLFDIEIPDICPVLGIRLSRAHGKHDDASPSLDRVDNSNGYVQGNVRVISWRANSIKGHGTAEEHARIAAYMRGHGVR